MVKKIISGGQTGVDRAALDIALELGIACGGWCPKGRIAEDGRIDKKYPLKETPSREYEERTEWNVRDSDGTVIMCRGTPSGGTAMAQEFAMKHKRPCMHINFFTSPRPEFLRNWTRQHNIEVLNIAGPRERTNNEIYEEAKAFLKSVFVGWEE